MQEGPRRDPTPFVVMAVAVLAATGFWLYSRPSSTGPESPRGAPSAEQEIQALLRQAQEHPKPLPPPPPKPKPIKDPWVVRGKVMDLYRLAPLKYAEVRFAHKFLGDEGPSAVTDASGSYGIELPQRREPGYFIQVIHRDCDSTRFFSGKAADWTGAPWEDRVRLGHTDQPHPAYRGKPGTPEEMDFALVPKEHTLSAEEAAKIKAVK